jgi:hypothetical protein
MILSGEAEAGWAVHEFFIRDILQVFDSVVVSMLYRPSIQLKTKYFLSRYFGFKYIAYVFDFCNCS